MSQTLKERNRVLLLEGFDVLFNQRDFTRAGGSGRRTTSTAQLSYRPGLFQEH